MSTGTYFACERSHMGRIGTLAGVLSCSLALAVAAPHLSAQQEAGQDQHQKAGEVQSGELQKPIGGVYFLDICPVDGKELKDVQGVVTYRYKGRELRFCSLDCLKKLVAEPQEYIERLNQKMIKIEREWYPLETCLISEEKLGGDRGEPVDYMHGNRLIRFCCDRCVPQFENDPDKFLKKLDAAVIEKQKERYPAGYCLVSGKTLESNGEHVNYILANRLIRLCSQDCIKTVEAQPAKIMAALRDAYKRQGERN